MSRGAAETCAPLADTSMHSATMTIGAESFDKVDWVDEPKGASRKALTECLGRTPFRNNASHENRASTTLGFVGEVLVTVYLSRQTLFGSGEACASPSASGASPKLSSMVRKTL